MKQSKSAAVTLLPLLSNAAALHTVLVIFAFRDVPIADHLGMLIWWGGLLVCHTALSLFVRKPRELRGVIVLCFVILALQLAAALWLNPVYPDFLSWVAMLCMWVYGYYQCGVGLLKGVKPEDLTVNFETTSVMLFVAAAIGSAGAMALGTVAHLVVGVLCILIALMRLRTLHTRMDSAEKQTAVGFLVPAILLGAGACAVLFCVLISGHAAQLLSRFTGWVASVLKLIAGGIGAFFLWLFSLFPTVEDPTGGEGFAPDALPSGTADMSYESNGVLLYILIAAVVIALVVLVLKVWRTIQVKGIGRKRMVVRAVVVEKSGLWVAVLRLLRRVLHRVRFEVRYWQSYHHLSGLLVWLERRMARKGIKRTTGETTRAYLQRIGEKYPDAEVLLTDLSKALDRHYFGDGREWDKEAVKQFRASLRKL